MTRRSFVAIAGALVVAAAITIVWFQREDSVPLTTERANASASPAPSSADDPHDELAVDHAVRSAVDVEAPSAAGAADRAFA